MNAWDGDLRDGKPGSHAPEYISFFGMTNSSFLFPGSVEREECVEGKFTTIDRHVRCELHVFGFNCNLCPPIQG
jgi:hypothetical protein